MLRPIFIINELYHIYNRGVEKRDIFMDDRDYQRFVYNLYEFNNEKTASNISYYFDKRSGMVQSGIRKGIRGPRIPFVDILVFTLMPNHFHLLLRQKAENGISRFMQKLGTGYSMYFNKKHERVGSLFQGKFKSVHINEEAHFIHLPHYIHTNPMKLNYQGRTSIDFLSDYRWSSFQDYIGRKNFPCVTSRSFLLDVFGGESGYLSHTKDRLGDEGNESILEQIEGVALD